MEVTTDEILKKMEGFVTGNLPVGPHRWLNYAIRLMVLIGDETDNLALLEKEVAKEKAKCIENGDSVASAEVKVEATDLYYDMRRQKAKIKKIEDFVLLAKSQAKLKDNELMGQ